MSRISRLIATRGLPGCGKTTRARLWVAEDPVTRCRVNRDDLRVMFHATRWSGIHECEDAVSAAQFAMIEALTVAGLDVISDDTWLNDRQFSKLALLADNAGIELEVWDMRDVPHEVCIERDAARGALVGADVIIGLYRRYIVGETPEVRRLTY